MTLSGAGKVFIWTKDFVQNWSAFAPNFTPLEANVEYVEREDEFDELDELGAEGGAGDEGGGTEAKESMCIDVITIKRSVVGAGDDDWDECAEPYVFAVEFRGGGGAGGGESGGENRGEGGG